MNENQTETHMDVNVNAKQSMTPAVIISALGLLAGLGANYATMVANDRELQSGQAQMRLDITRVERDSKDLKGEILGELREIRTELRERSKAGH